MIHLFFPGYRSVHRIIIFFISIFSFAGTADAEWVEWIADLEGGILNESNINRSSFDSDKRSDAAFIPSASLGRYNQLTDSTRLRATVDFEGGQYNNYKPLNYNRAGITLSLRQKIGFGSDAPWLRPHLSAAYMDVGSDIRDSYLYEAGLRLGKRLTPEFDGRIGYVYNVRDGKSDVFDQRGYILSIEGGYIITNRFLLTGGYSYWYGDFDSAYTYKNISHVTAGEEIKAMTTDYAFNEKFWIYKLEGKANIISIMASYSLLNGHGSLNVGYQQQSGKAYTLEYLNSIVRASFIYSF
jgi:hypothetical protein